MYDNGEEVSSFIHNLKHLIIKMRAALGASLRMTRLMTTSSTKSSSSMGRNVFLGSCISLTFGLGSWQVYRYHWKRDLIEERSSLLNREALSERSFLDILRDEKRHDALSYARVQASGVLERSKTVLLGPRAPPNHTAAFDDRKPGAEKTGYYVFVPLRLNNNDESRILVCEGWLPKSAIQANPDAKSSDVSVSVEGVISDGEKKPPFALEHDMKRQRFIWLDMNSMLPANGKSYLSRTKYLNALRVEDAKSERDVRPVTKPIEAHKDFYVTTWHHVGYAATWFTLSAATLTMTLLKYRRR